MTFDTFRCITLLYFVIRLESRKSANKRIYLSIYTIAAQTDQKSPDRSVLSRAAPPTIRQPPAHAASEVVMPSSAASARSGDPGPARRRRRSGGFVIARGKRPRSSPPSLNYQFHSNILESITGRRCYCNEDRQPACGVWSFNVVVAAVAELRPGATRERSQRQQEIAADRVRHFTRQEATTDAADRHSDR